jgi:plasmid stabilization system protein ParE
VIPERKLRWQDAAVSDLEEAHARLSQDNPGAARRFAATILEAAEQLLTYPELGPVAHDLQPPNRYRSLTRGRHRLIYRIDSEVIWLLRVWDTRRDPGSLEPEPETE